MYDCISHYYDQEKECLYTYFQKKSKIVHNMNTTIIANLGEHLQFWMLLIYYWGRNTPCTLYTNFNFLPKTNLYNFRFKVGWEIYNDF